MAASDSFGTWGPVPVFRTLGEALRLYRLLFVRSVTVAAFVYGVVALAEIVHHVTSGAPAALISLFIFLLTIAGPAFVQGALVVLVRNIHEGRRAAPIGELVRETRPKLLRLIGASFVYAFGVAAGLVLLIVPGLVAAARWSLMPPIVMFEDRRISEARRRSSVLVKGYGPPVFVCILIGALLVVPVAVYLAFSGFSFGTRTFAGFVLSSLTAPFEAHVLTALYYRRADPQSPVIHPDVRTWRSVWEGK